LAYVVFTLYLRHSIHGPRNQCHGKTPSCFTASAVSAHPGRFLDKWQGWIHHLTSLEHSKCQSRLKSCPRIGDVQSDVLVIPGYAPWKQISNLITLASTQHGNTLRIENTGSTSWKLLHSSLGHARNDDTYTMTIIFWEHHCV